VPAAKRRLLETRADADDLADDYALLRKVKKGKITEVRPHRSKEPWIWFPDSYNCATPVKRRLCKNSMYTCMLACNLCCCCSGCQSCSLHHRQPMRMMYLRE
jgi:hypothetical protein